MAGIWPGQLQIMGVATASSYMLGGSEALADSHNPWRPQRAPVQDVKTTKVLLASPRERTLASTCCTVASRWLTLAAAFFTFPRMLRSISLPSAALAAGRSGA